MSMSPRSHPSPAFASASARSHPYAPREHSQSRRRHHSPAAAERLPPSPPRSTRRDNSVSPPTSAKPTMLPDSAPATPSFDTGDNYWDDVPAAPASLKSILESFRLSGEGDRDLLISILGAKKAEEERLTAIVQTRLTVLQARLNLAAIQAQMAAPVPPMPHMMPPPPPVVERTPSLSNSVSSNASSPRMAHAGRTPASNNQYWDAGVHLPPPTGYDSHHSHHRFASIHSHHPHQHQHPHQHPHQHHRERSDSAASRRPEGLEMLLEGVREAERKERM